jgi:hypothetical protein
MKHTQGPWKFEASTKTIRSEPANYWLATMDSWDGAVDHEANARLIAAAPELLEALERLLDTRAFGNLERKEYEELIAKARGES